MEERDITTARPAAIECEGIIVPGEGDDALHEVSVSVPQGATTFIMGPSGCGKSLLLKVAAGLAIPERGTVTMKGMNIRTVSERSLFDLKMDYGFVFQDAALWANMTIYQNLALPIETHSMKFAREDVREMVESMARHFRISQLLQLRPSSLSTGERKVVSFLRGIITDPTILFLDEPLGSMDHAAAERIVAELRHQKQEGKTLLVATHDAQLTSMLADHLIIMKDGRILLQGGFSEVVRSRDPAVIEILTRVLSEASTFDTDILDLLSGDGTGRPGT